MKLYPNFKAAAKVASSMASKKKQTYQVLRAPVTGVGWYVQVSKHRK